jgi:hypothetical protein
MRILLYDVLVCKPYPYTTVLRRHCFCKQNCYFMQIDTKRFYVKVQTQWWDSWNSWTNCFLQTLWYDAIYTYYVQKNSHPEGWREAHTLSSFYLSRLIKTRKSVRLQRAVNWPPALGDKADVLHQRSTSCSCKVQSILENCERIQQARSVLTEWVEFTVSRDIVLRGVQFSLMTVPGLLQRYLMLWHVNPLLGNARKTHG